MRRLTICLMLLCAASFAGIDVLVAHADPGYISGATANITDPMYDSVYFMNVSSSSGSTPDLATLEGYSVVLTWADYTYADATTLGNNLADYADAGGSVVIAMFGIDPSWGLAGRIISDAAYSPLLCTGSNFSSVNMGTVDTTHPIMAGVSSITGIYYWGSASLESGATWVGDLSNGTDFAAVNADANVSALNIYPGDARQWTGDGWVLFNNALKYMITQNMPHLDSVDVNGDTVILDFDRDTNQPTINEGNIDDVLALDDGAKAPKLGQVRAISARSDDRSPHSWLSGDGSLGGATWTSPSTLEVTLSLSGGKPSMAIGDTVTCDGATISLASVDNPSQSECTVTGDFNDWTITETSWGALKAQY